MDYFPHFAHQNKPLRIINKKYGNDGYAFYFKLRELLAKTDYHNYDLSNDIDWQDFVSEMDIDEKKAVKLIEKDDWDKNTMNDLVKTMGDASICGLGQAAGNPISCVLKYFKEYL